MPIPASYSPMELGFSSSWNMGKGAQIQSSSQMFLSSLASVVPMGLYPMGLSIIPLTPAGLSASIGIMVSGLSMGRGAQISTTSKQMAQAISVLAPICPPAGLSILSSLIEASMSMGKGARVDTVAKQIAQAVVTYYQAGGTL